MQPIHARQAGDVIVAFVTVQVVIAGRAALTEQIGVDLRRARQRAGVGEHELRLVVCADEPIAERQAIRAAVHSEEQVISGSTQRDIAGRNRRLEDDAIERRAVDLRVCIVAIVVVDRDLTVAATIVVSVVARAADQQVAASSGQRVVAVEPIECLGRAAAGQHVRAGSAENAGANAGNLREQAVGQLLTARQERAVRELEPVDPVVRRQEPTLYRQHVGSAGNSEL